MLRNNNSQIRKASYFCDQNSNEILKELCCHLLQRKDYDQKISKMPHKIKGTGVNIFVLPQLLKSRFCQKSRWQWSS